MNAPDEVEQREEGADQEQSASNNLHGNMGSSMSLSVSLHDSQTLALHGRPASLMLQRPCQ